MNKVILLGRLVRDPEVRYSQSAEPIAVARYTLAVARRTKSKDGKQEADFIKCVAFGKNGEFAEKHLSKGQLISIVGRLQVRRWEDLDGSIRWTTEVIVEEYYFAEGKKNGPKNAEDSKQEKHTYIADESSEGFYPIDESLEDDDLPF